MKKKSSYTKKDTTSFDLELKDGRLVITKDRISSAHFYKDGGASILISITEAQLDALYKKSQRQKKYFDGLNKKRKILKIDPIDNYAINVSPDVSLFVSRK